MQRPLMMPGRRKKLKSSERKSKKIRKQSTNNKWKWIKNKKKRKWQNRSVFFNNNYKKVVY